MAACFVNEEGGDAVAACGSGMGPGGVGADFLEGTRERGRLVPVLRGFRLFGCVAKDAWRWGQIADGKN